MKHILFTLFLTVMVTSQSWSQDTWVKTFGGGKDIWFPSISSTSDGGVLITSHTSSNDGDFLGSEKRFSDVFIIELDKNGQVLWKKITGGSETDFSSSITRSNEDVLITGQSLDDGEYERQADTGKNLFVMKLDRDGRTLWKSLFGGTSYETSTSLCVASDGGILVTGSTTSNDGDFKGMNKGGVDIFVIKLDRDGRVLWSRTYGGTGGESGESIVSTPDGGFVITGSTTSSDGDFGGPNKGQRDMFVIKIDNNGKLLWKRTLGGIEDDFGESITRTSDGGVVLVGTSRSNNGDFRGMNRGVSDIFVIKLDRNGEILWKKSFGGSEGDNCNSVTTSSDGGILVTGWTESNDGDFEGRTYGDVFIIKIRSNGELQWSRTYGGSRSEGCSSISTSSDGSIYISGLTSSTDGDFEGMKSYPHTLYVMKLDSNGNLKPSGKKKSKKK